MHDHWKEYEDAALVRIIVREQEEDNTLSQAFIKASKELNRTHFACKKRWYTKLKAEYEKKDQEESPYIQLTLDDYLGKIEGEPASQPEHKLKAQSNAQPEPEPQSKSESQPDFEPEPQPEPFSPGEDRKADKEVDQEDHLKYGERINYLENKVEYLELENLKLKVEVELMRRTPRTGLEEYL